MNKFDELEANFADNYTDARKRFLNVCAKKSIKVSSYINPQTVSVSQELATDVIRIGSENAKKLLVITSGVHGAELMCGSGCQISMLSQGCFDDVPDDTAVVMVHAINPWGAANLRRNTEDNVDLCRNFIDFSGSLPVNTGYEEIHSALSCTEFEGPERDKANRLLNTFRDTQGTGSFIGAVMSGQYQYPSGMSFGGEKATWSRETLEKILQEHGQQAEHVCLIDYHSGLGPYGYGVLVCMQQDTSLQRARDWFGEWVTAPMAEHMSGNDEFHPAIGHTTIGHELTLSHARVTSVVLEYGTYAMDVNLQTLLQDHWLNQFGDPGSQIGKAIKQRMLKTHYPDDPEWRYAVWTRSEQVIRQALQGLATQ